MNRIKAPQKREEFGEALVAAWHDWLRLGWNSITDQAFKIRNIVQVKTNTTMNFCEALDFALEKKKPDVADRKRNGKRSRGHEITERTKY